MTKHEHVTPIPKDLFAQLEANAFGPAAKDDWPEWLAERAGLNDQIRHFIDHPEDADGVVYELTVEVEDNADADEILAASLTQLQADLSDPAGYDFGG